MYSDWAIAPGALTRDECEYIIAALKPKLVRAGDGSSAFNEEVRRARSCHITRDHGENPEIFGLLDKWVKEASRSLGIVYDHKETQATLNEYVAPAGHYVGHTDAHLSHYRTPHRDRKMTCVLQLSNPRDYVGGDLQIRSYRRPNPEMMRPQGTVIVFPAFLTHAVTPVTVGKRYSMAAWYVGPHWK